MCPNIETTVRRDCYVSDDLIFATTIDEPTDDYTGPIDQVLETSASAKLWPWSYRENCETSAARRLGRCKEFKS